MTAEKGVRVRARCFALLSAEQPDRDRGCGRGVGLFSSESANSIQLDKIDSHD